MAFPAEAHGVFLELAVAENVALPTDLQARLNAERARAKGTGEKTTAPTEGEVGAEMQIARDLGEVAILHSRQDPRWEALFDSVEERLDDVASPRLQSYAFRAYLRMGLTRPAYRHWLRAQKPSSVELVAALWREELRSSYRIVVASMCAEEGDWCAVSGNVELAIAQHNAGDLEGAQHTAAAAAAGAADGDVVPLKKVGFPRGDVVRPLRPTLPFGDLPRSPVWASAIGVGLPMLCRCTGPTLARSTATAIAKRTAASGDARSRPARAHRPSPSHADSSPLTASRSMPTPSTG